MSDGPLTDASQHAHHLAVKVDANGRPVADAEAELRLGRGWTLELHAQYGKAMADRSAALELNWRGR